MLLLTAITCCTLLACVNSFTKSLEFKVSVLAYRGLDVFGIKPYKLSYYYFNFCICASRIHDPERSASCQCSKKRLEDAKSFKTSGCAIGDTSHKCITVTLRPRSRNSILYVKVTLNDIAVTYPEYQQMPIAEKKRYIQLSCLRNPFICKGCGIYCKNGNIDLVYVVERYYKIAKRRKSITYLIERQTDSSLIKHISNSENTIKTSSKADPIDDIKQYLLEATIGKALLGSKFNSVKFRDEMIRYHNIYRRLHGAAPLDYDDRIESYARNWSDKLVNRFACIEHDPMRRYGENIFFYAATVLPNESALARMALHSFYTESNGYDYKTHNNMNYRNRGHFTQLIWKNTKRLGIGVSIGHWLNQYANNCMPKFPAFVVYVVVKYDPPGNIHKLDYYNQNVSPAQSINIKFFKR